MTSSEGEPDENGEREESVEIDDAEEIEGQLTVRPPERLERFDWDEVPKIDLARLEV